MFIKSPFSSSNYLSKAIRRFDLFSPSLNCPMSRADPVFHIDKHMADPDAPVPILLNPESLKICVTGGPGPDMIAYIGTWGYGPSHFITKPIKLPPNWNELLEKNKGWESPTVK